MSYESRLVDDVDFFRETRRFHAEQDALEREEAEEARAERDRYAAPEVRVPLVVRRP
jgi:hypothetical protein